MQCIQTSAFCLVCYLKMGGRLAGSVEVRLTQTVKAGGCASKLAPGLLANVLSRLPRQSDPNVLVGFDTSDDAGIYRIAANLALVQTVDFFTPLVDDPFTFGQIAATNALSDVYAMGGEPATALSIVCFPQDGDLDVLEQIMRGGMSKMSEAGCAVVGGHSVRDAEIKFGYAVTGLIDPQRVLTNTGAQAGDVLILTKPIGTGVITTALKQGKAKPAWVANAVESMTTLNRAASRLVTAASGVHAMTDVTGFGLMGHGRELALGSGMRIEIAVEQVPRIEGARCHSSRRNPGGSAGESRIRRVHQRGRAGFSHPGRFAHVVVRSADRRRSVSLSCSRFRGRSPWSASRCKFECS